MSRLHFFLLLGAMAFLIWFLIAAPTMWVVIFVVFGEVVCVLSMIYCLYRMVVP